MKKQIFKFGMILSISTLLTSCYSYTTVVGNGAKGTEKVSKWNPYFVEGLIQGKQVNPKELAGNSTDYTVNTKLSFGNMLVGAVTLGIYTPTTVTVTK